MVFLAVRKDLIISHRSDFDSDCEVIRTKCQLLGPHTKSIYFRSFYRPKASDTKSLQELQTSLLKMGLNLHKNSVILAGDFNAPDIDWNNTETPTNLSP